jgi:ribosomal protein S18 acetylase RimI-like enzyme
LPIVLDREHDNLASMAAMDAQVTPPLIVRRAVAGDVSGIARVHVRSWQSAYRGHVPAAVLDSLDEGKRASRWHELLEAPGHALQVAVLHDAAVLHDTAVSQGAGGSAVSVVGFCSFIPTRDTDAESATGEVAALYVSPERWRSGVGQALLRATLDVARLRRYRAVTLWVLAANVAARAFYEKLGFALDGASKVEERSSYSLTEVRYRIELSPPSERR